MRFRPCIDIHQGRVKEIVGTSLTHDENALQTNFVSQAFAEDFARIYKGDNLAGGHVVMLDNSELTQQAAIRALKAYPKGMQIGGGINIDNGEFYLESGASKLIVTSWLFPAGQLDISRAEQLMEKFGRERLVFDLSCRRKPPHEYLPGEIVTPNDYFVVINKWQTFTNTKVTPQSLNVLSQYCSEFLVHGVDQEGKKRGIDKNLVMLLAEHSPLPVTYAGGIRNEDDLDTIEEYGKGQMDFTVGSGLDLLGGDLAYHDLVAWYRQEG